MESLINIRNRRSVRTFSPEHLQPGHRETIDHIIGSANETKGPFGTRPRILDLDAVGDDVPRKIGTYGVIKGPQGFLVGICTDDRGSVIDLGHAMEGVVLAMTGLGVGTCWLGGTFKRTHIEERVDMGDDEVVAAVIPYGYPAQQRRLVEGLMKRAAGSSQRRPLDELFRCPESVDGDIIECLEAVRLAPSSMNNQPWRGVGEDGRVHLQMVTPKRPEGPLMRMRYLDMGIAMQHLEAVSAQKFGDVMWTWEKLSSVEEEGREYIATLTFGQGTDGP